MLEGKIAIINKVTVIYKLSKFLCWITQNVKFEICGAETSWFYMFLLIIWKFQQWLKNVAEYSCLLKCIAWHSSLL